MLLAAISIGLLPHIAFDFDPLNLKNPKTESVSTARDLMKDPMTTPYTAEILVPSLEGATSLAERLSHCHSSKSFRLSCGSARFNGPQLTHSFVSNYGATNL